jgi:hypothetical protein
MAALGSNGVSRDGRRRVNAASVLALVFSLTNATACGGTLPASEPAAAPTRVAGTRTEISVMLADMIARDACEQIRGKFLAVPEDSVIGPDAGETPINGRWWIHECSAKSESSFVTLHLAGFGWRWVDESKFGFKLRRYVYFNAAVDAVGGVDITYDPPTHVASMWFSPTGVRVGGGGVGHVETESSLGGMVLNVLTLGLAESYADTKAREQISVRVRSTLMTMMSRGFTITYDVERRQADMLPQALAAGIAPRRPFKGDLPWLANERQIIRAERGGAQLIGPFDPAIGVDVDVVVENGVGSVQYRPLCEADVAIGFAPVMTGAYPKMPIANNQTAMARYGEPRTVRIAMPTCRWFFVTEAVGAAVTVGIRMRGSRRLLIPPDP